MRKYAWMIALFVAGLTWGCSESVTVPPPRNQIETGPHQGTAYQLEDLGFAELVNEPEVDARSGNTPTSVVVYFLQPDGKTAMPTPPTEVSLKVTKDRSASQSLALKAQPKSGDPAGSARFESPTGPYALDQVRGTLTVTVGGKKIEKQIAGGR